MAVAASVIAQRHAAASTSFIAWSGGVRKAAGFTKGMSTIMLMGRDGKVLFSHEGAMAGPERTRLLALLKEQVEQPQP